MFDTKALSEAVNNAVEREKLIPLSVIMVCEKCGNKFGVRILNGNLDVSQIYCYDCSGKGTDWFHA